jgi:hypothetical protein
VDAIATMEVLVSHFGASWTKARSHLEGDCERLEAGADMVAPADRRPSLPL